MLTVRYWRLSLVSLGPCMAAACVTPEQLEDRLGLLSQEIGEQRATALMSLREQIGRERKTALSTLEGRIDGALKNEAMERTREDKELLQALDRNMASVTTRVGQLELNIDQFGQAVEEDLARIEGSVRSLHALLTSMPLNYHGRIYLAARSITDDVVAAAAIERMRQHIASASPRSLSGFRAPFCL